MPAPSYYFTLFKKFQAGSSPRHAAARRSNSAGLR